MKPELEEKLGSIVRRYEELNNLMAQPDVATDPPRLQELAKEQASIEELVTGFLAYQATLKAIGDTRSLVEEESGELQEMAREELGGLQKRLDGQEDVLKRLLLPRDPNDAKDVIVEVRAGAGGTRRVSLPPISSVCTTGTLKASAGTWKC